MAEDLMPVEFILEDALGGKPVSPANVDLPTLRAFLAEVETLIKGDSTNLSLADSRVELKPGSLKVVALLAATVASNLQFDMGKLAVTSDLDQIQNKRAEVIRRWQQRAEKSPSRRYAVLPMDSTKAVQVASQSHYQRHSENAWVEVEKYLTGTVENQGGRQSPNIHLFMGDTGTMVVIAASKEQLREQKENRLYKNATLFVRVEQHLLNKSLRNAVLISFVKAPEAVDEDALQILWAKGREAWRDAGSATAWVEGLRGNEQPL